MVDGCAYNHVRLHNVRMRIHGHGALCMLFLAHLASYFRSVFLGSGFHGCPSEKLEVLSQLVNPINVTNLTSIESLKIFSSYVKG